jgi:hypothetical protein
LLAQRTRDSLIHHTNSDSVLNSGPESLRLHNGVVAVVRRWNGRHPGAGVRLCDPQQPLSLPLSRGAVHKGLVNPEVSVVRRLLLTARVRNIRMLDPLLTSHGLCLVPTRRKSACRVVHNPPEAKTTQCRGETHLLVLVVAEGETKDRLCRSPHQRVKLPRLSAPLRQRGSSHEVNSTNNTKRNAKQKHCRL